MFCRSCGTQNADGAPTCTACGASLTNPFGATTETGSPVPAGGKPDNYLIPSILVTLCCCLPLGIVGIVYASQVDSKWNSGDQQGAIEAAANAKKWTMIGLGLGIVANLIVFGIQILAIIGAAANANQGNF